MWRQLIRPDINLTHSSFGNIFITYAPNRKLEMHTPSFHIYTRNVSFVDPLQAVSIQDHKIMYHHVLSLPKNHTGIWNVFLCHAIVYLIWSTAWLINWKRGELPPQPKHLLLWCVMRDSISHALKVIQYMYVYVYVYITINHLNMSLTLLHLWWKNNWYEYFNSSWPSDAILWRQHIV